MCKWTEYWKQYSVFYMLGKFFPNILKNAPLRMRTYNELRTDTKKHLDEGNENGYNIVTSL